MFWSSVPCIRSLKSAGQFIVNFVMGLMVGDRRFPGATILGVETIYLLSQPSRVSPAGFSRRDGSFFLCNLTVSFVFWYFGSAGRRGVAWVAVQQCYWTLRRPSGLPVQRDSCCGSGSCSRMFFGTPRTIENT